MKSIARLQVRIPDDLHAWLVDFAARNDRSANSQIVAMIREKAQEQGFLKLAPPRDCLAAVSGGAEPDKENGHDKQSEL